MKELIISLTIGCLSLSVLMFLLPTSEKTLKYVVSLVFLCMIVIPLTNALPLFKVESIETEMPDVKQEVLNLNVTSLKHLIEDILNKNYIEFKDILVFADISEDYSITIKTVKIISNESSEKIMSALKELDFIKVVEKYEGTTD